MPRPAQGAITPIDDPCEAPLKPEIARNTVEREPEDNARLILDYLIQNGFVQGGLNDGHSALQPVRAAAVFVR